MLNSSKPKMNFYSFNLNHKKGKIMDAAKNKRSQGRGTKSLTKSLFNSIVFGKEVIMKKIKMKKRFGLNRQKSRGIVENVLSGTKAGFQAILNIEHAIERKKMENQKSKSTFSAILLSLTLMVAAFWVSPAAAQKYVTDPTTGKVVSAPEYGGTLTYAWSGRVSDNQDPFVVGMEAGWLIDGVNERLAIGDWAIDRDEFDFKTDYTEFFALTGYLAESWETPDPLTYIFHIRQGVHYALDPDSEASRLVNGRELTARSPSCPMK